MKILVIAPNERPKRVEIPHTLEEMQRAVGGNIQAVYPWKDLVALVCDEEGLINGKPLNRYVMPGMVIAGTFFICGLGEEDFTDLPDDMAEKYEQMFRHPQAFVRVNEDIIAIGEDGSLTRVEL
ncbi:MAG: DUF3846 domain-containing protein [Clostridia bacterium]|nr:DUF3846 domain-containing protein [Clostridia bacterium]